MRITAIIAVAVSWLAPVPSAYFVAVSSMQHLSAPLPIAVIIAVVLEGLGLSCSHLALAFWNHNTHTHRLAQYRVAWVEFYLAMAMYLSYFVATLALLAMLELAWVTLLFPVLATVGVVNLALREQLAQLRRMPVKRAAQEHAEVTPEIAKVTPEIAKVTPKKARGTYQDYLALLAQANGNGNSTVAEMAEELSVPKRTLYNWISRHNSTNGGKA